MTGAVIFLHVVACIFLMVVILMQSGRGGGLTEGFAPAESLFGAKTNQFMVRATVILASIFLVTSLSMTYLSSQRNKSLVERLTDKAEKQKEVEIPKPVSQTVPVNAVNDKPL